MLWPHLFNCCHAHKPQGPLPIIAIFLFVRYKGNFGWIQFSRNPLSIIEFSILLIYTGPSLIPSTHHSSHGHGHVVPVNSGKLFVSNNLSNHFFQSSACTSWFHTGIRFHKGQPPPPWFGNWQVGVPQSMQRAVWVLIKFKYLFDFELLPTVFQ